MSFFLKGPFVYGEVRTGRVGVTAGSLQWKSEMFGVTTEPSGLAEMGTFFACCRTKITNL
jgi:hypothetical protein